MEEKAALQDVDVGCDKKVGDVGNKQDAGIRWCLACMRGRKRCKDRIDKLTSCSVLVGLLMIGEKTEGSIVVGIHDSIRE